MAHESLILFAKPPRPGRVKTRLVPALGEEGAARLYACFLRDAADAARTLGRARPGAALVCEWALEPGESLGQFPLSDWLPGRFLHRAQTGANLGERMAAALGRCLVSGRRAVLIGTDFPDLPGGVLAGAFDRLESADAPAAALGPATDGGYYLIGMNRFRPEIFRDIPWSTGAVLSRTKRRARALGLSAALLPEWRDTDDARDIQALAARLAGAPHAPHTRGFLDRPGL